MYQRIPRTPLLFLSGLVTPKTKGLVAMVPFLESIAIYKPSDVRQILKAYEGEDVPLEYGKGETQECRLRPFVRQSFWIIELAFAGNRRGTAEHLLVVGVTTAGKKEDIPPVNGMSTGPHRRRRTE